MEQRIMAFWPYDMFPFYLCGEVEKFIGANVYIPSFQMTVRPAFVLSLEEGQRLKEYLDRLKSDRLIEIVGINTAYQNLVNEAITRYTGISHEKQTK